MLKVLRFLLATALLFSGTMLASAPVVYAGTQGSDCPNDPRKVRLWENAAGQTDDGNDSYWRCTAADDLATVNHTEPGDCNRPWPASTTWNDCVSSFTVWVNAGWKLCLYEDAGETGLKATYFGPITGYRYDVGVGWNDRLSSFKWVTTSC